MEIEIQSFKKKNGISWWDFHFLENFFFVTWYYTKHSVISTLGYWQLKRFCYWSIKNQGGQETIHIDARMIGKMRNHYFHDPANFCMEFIIALIFLSLALVTESIQSILDLFWKKIINSRIIIPEVFLLFGSFNMRRKSAYFHFCNIDCCIIA